MQLFDRPSVVHEGSREVIEQFRMARTIARRSEIAKRDEETGNGYDRLPTDTVSGFADGLHQSLQVTNFSVREGKQHRNRTHDVTESDRQSGDEQGKRHGPPWILDFFAHERRGLAAAESEGQHRPENDVLEMQAGNQCMRRE